MAAKKRSGSRGSASGAEDFAIAAAARDSLSDLRAAKREWSQRLLAPSGVVAAGRAMSAAARRVPAAASAAPEQNVVGVGVAEKTVNGQPTGLLCVKFFVRVKFASSHLSRGDKLPTQIDGIAVDVEQVGVFRKFATKRGRKRQASGPIADPRTRRRPARPGCSIGYRDPADAYVMAGTFGALVRRGGQRFILSNNHVLADENRLPKGSAIFQPGLLDHGHAPADQIATLTDYVRLRAGANNRVDAAIAALQSPNVAIPEILFIGKPKGSRKAAIDMVVHKFGRTTSYTAGRVTSIDTDVSVDYDTGTFTFADQMIIKGLNQTSFSNAGDSGSLITERGTNAAVGLLFAGSSTYTIANHIDAVLAQFGGITLV
jgi:hypothetical protein